MNNIEYMLLKNGRHQKDGGKIEKNDNEMLIKYLLLMDISPYSTLERCTRLHDPKIDLYNSILHHNLYANSMRFRMPCIYAYCTSIR